MSADIAKDGRPLTQGERYEKAATLLDKLFTPIWREMGDKTKTAPVAAQDFGQICVEQCYADAWGRDTLDLKTRSIITLSALAAMGCHEEIKMHTRIALNIGHTQSDILEFFIQLIPYVGVPKMLGAMRSAGEVFAQIAEAETKSAPAGAASSKT